MGNNDASHSFFVSTNLVEGICYQLKSELTLKTR